ncbi:hypothetical protein [Erwinia sp. JH02]|uniref:hypothetical protein n=1 Tax=Erwinia sp. JH02 TaxID=2733394 RepID=UPI00148969ED|nr:hypothetical protein [Erwinia sp. JH02]NNS07346.1 hypothetical protein [Erwinia sp. JH02]
MYNKKTLRYDFSVKPGDFDGRGNDKLSLNEVKSNFHVGSYGNVSGTNAEITIFGLSADLLSVLSGKGLGVFAPIGNIGVEVYAGKTKMFSGGIFASYANMNAQPETALIINAVAGLSLRTSSSSAFSFSGDIDVANMLEAICKLSGYAFRSEGVKGIKHSNPYFSGSPMDQIRDICLAHELWYQVIDNVVTVWPYKSTSGTAAITVGPENGLIGYPVFSQGGITFQTQFSPLLSQGRDVNLITSLPNASGLYRLSIVEHYLSSWTDGGNWHSVCQAFRITEAAR